MLNHNEKLKSLIILDTDYTDYGGKIERWKDDDDYPDCSCGCKWFWTIDNDFGVCLNPKSPRQGMLTFEHQTGKNCFEVDDEK